MRTVADAMITDMKVHPMDATVADVRALFADEHVHCALLVEGDVLRAVLLRDDLPAACADGEPALLHGALAGRVIGPDEELVRVREGLLRAGGRRLAVVTPEGNLAGLLCLKRSHRGFCSESDVHARRAQARRVPTSEANATMLLR